MPALGDRHRPSRLPWLIPAVAAALGAVLLFMGGVAANLVATDLDHTLKPYRLYVWIAFLVALVLTVAGAVRQVMKAGGTAEITEVANEAGSSATSAKPARVVAAELDGETLVVRMPPAVNALHQLPPPPRDFTGREEELKELTAQIGRGGVNISGLRGLGGVGKTTLALKLAEQLRPQYPDAQFYLDLKGVSTQPVTVPEALAHVVRAYHPTAKLPEAEAELRALYLSVLDGQRALLLMDNAKDAAQVAPLIPPAGCMLIVTSRQRFTLPGLYAKDLDTLSAKESRALLLKVAPRLGEHADAIARLCGHLPLALRLAASALAERGNLSATDYVRRLTDERKRLELVNASLTLSYDLLNSELQKLWSVLAVFPDTFDTAAAAAVWEAGLDAAQDTLGELIRYSLVEWEEEAARHRLHDLARLFAYTQLSKEERGTGQMRHATHYLGVIKAAEALYLQGGEPLKRGLRLLDLEWRNIQAGHAWAEEQYSENNLAASLCSNYSDAGLYLLDLRLHPREQIRWLEAALAAARRLNDRAAEAAHLGNLGVAYQNLGEARRAAELHEQHLVIAREIGQRQGEGNALGNLGNAYIVLGEPRRAIEFYEQWLVIAREIGDQRGEGNALGSLGNVYDELSEPHRAIEFYEQALVTHRKINDRRGEGQDLGNLGGIYAALGETRRAVEFHKQQLAITREIGDRRGEGYALYNIGLVFDSLGDRAQATAYAVGALEIFEQIESPQAERVRAKIALWLRDASE